jgi:hypothetical protein
MKYVISEDVLTAHLSDEAVLLHVGSKRYFRLNSTGAWIWKGIEQGMSRAELLEGLCARFEVERADAERSLDDQLTRLREADLLHEAREADARAPENHR